MKVVIDTNILVSAVIRDRLPERVLLWCLHNPKVAWLATPAILAEYTTVIQRPKFALSEATVTWWLELIAADVHVIQATAEIDFPRDRKDAPFLICAESGKADYLITGDSDFSEAQALIQTRIINVSDFAKRIIETWVN